MLLILKRTASLRVLQSSISMDLFILHYTRRGIIPLAYNPAVYIYAESFIKYKLLVSHIWVYVLVLQFLH